METVPLISVLMPVYNAEQYIREATESILNQTFRDFEFIITDDGSTDSSREILEEYAANDPRVNLISRPNTGHTTALNQMLAIAKGKYIARMDADDVSMPDRFEKQVAYLNASPECVCVGSRILTIDPFGSPLYEPNHRLVHDEIDKQLLSGVGWSIVHPAAMILKSAIMSVGQYRPETEPAEDLGFVSSPSRVRKNRKPAGCVAAVSSACQEHQPHPVRRAESQDPAHCRRVV